jgi:uncharacterized membrane protein YgcG
MSPRSSLPTLHCTSASGSAVLSRRRANLSAASRTASESLTRSTRSTCRTPISRALISVAAVAVLLAAAAAGGAAEAAVARAQRTQCVAVQQPFLHARRACASVVRSRRVDPSLLPSCLLVAVVDTFCMDEWWMIGCMRLAGCDHSRRKKDGSRGGGGGGGGGSGGSGWQ